MKITEQDATKRLNSESNLASLSVEHKPVPHRGTSKRGQALPEFLRDTLSDLANQPDVKQSDIADAFNVSDSEVSFCKSGEIGGKPATDSRKKKVDARLEKIKDTALLKLMQSLNLIDDDRLEKCSAKELSGVALSMSRIIKDHTPVESTSTGPQVNVVIYSPETKSITDYKVVDA